MQEKKQITFPTVILTAIGAAIWILVCLFNIEKFADTTTLGMLISTSVAWSFAAVLRIIKYVTQKNRVKLLNKYRVYEGGI